MKKWLFFAACGAALLACDPVWYVHTNVLTAAPCTAASSSGTAAPLEGATVRIDCPGRPSPDSGKTDATGRVALANAGFLPGCNLGRCSDDPTRSPGDEGATPSCRVVIEKEGYSSQSYPLAPFCQAYAGDRCYRVALTVTLSPAGDAKASPQAP